MAVDVKLEFTLRPKQRAFVDSRQTWTAFIGGVGSGKTHSGAIKSIVAAIEEPGSLGLIGAPTYTMLRDTTQRKFFDLLPKELIQSFNKNEQHLTLINGSEILFRSLEDPDKLRGLNLAWFWMDEGPLSGHYAFKLLKQRAGRQDKTRYKKRGWITGTPKGRDGFYVEFEKNPTPEHLLIKSSTRENLKNLPDNYIEDMGFVGAFFQQEVEGSFEAFEGLVYTFYGDLDNDNNPYNHVMDIPPGKRFRRVIGGVDWGFTNPATALVFGIDGDTRVWEIAEFYERGVQLEETHIPTIVQFTKEFGVAAWYCDPAEPEHIQKLKDALDLNKIDCEVYQADNTITTGIQTVQRFLNLRGDNLPGLVVDASCVHTIAEFNSYQYAKNVETQPDDFVNEKPIKQSDHAMDSLRYAIHTELGGVIPGTPFTAGGAGTVTPSAEMRRQIAYLERIDPTDEDDDDPYIAERRSNAAASLRFIADRLGGIR